MFGRKESAAPPRPGLGVPGVPGQEGVEPELAAMLLRGEVGKPPIGKEEIAKAAELLKLTELAVKDISNAVGYPNQLHFSRAFKSIYGISPRQWRAENRIIS